MRVTGLTWRREGFEIGLGSVLDNLQLNNSSTHSDF